MFVPGKEQHKVVETVCRNCRAKTECLAYALDHRLQYGVWGGWTERQRRALLHKFPHITDWRAYILRAITPH